MLHALLHFVGISVAVFLLSRLLPGMRIRDFKTAFAVAAVYGLVNWGLKFLVFKVLFFISWPLLLLTLGLFALVVNAVALKITDAILDDFELAGWGTALLGALGISAAGLVLGVLL